MAKYAVYSKWYWKNGVPEVDFVQDWLRTRRSEMIAEDTILFQVDDHHHCSLTIYASEADFNQERPSVLEERKRNHEEGAQIIEENVGPYLGQMSTV